MKEFDTTEDYIKAGLSMLSGFGVSAIVSGVVNNSVPKVSPFKNVCVILAKLGISMVISDAVDRKFSEVTDMVSNSVKKAVSETKIKMNENSEASE